MGINKMMAKQLRCPDGLFSKAIGKMVNKGNENMNRFTLERLSLEEQDAVLEIGFGNGKYIAELASQRMCAKIAGVDYSEAMVKQAMKRNRAFIRDGLVEIRQGSSDNLPYENGAFSKVFTVNTIYFWPEPMADLAEIYRVLRPGGTFLLVFRSKNKMEKLSFTKHGFRLYEPSEVISLVKNAGFNEIKLETAEDRSLDINCVIAK